MYCIIVDIVPWTDHGQRHADTAVLERVSGFAGMGMYASIYASNSAIFYAMVTNFKNESQQFFVLYLWPGYDLLY